MLEEFKNKNLISNFAFQKVKKKPLKIFALNPKVVEATLPLALLKLKIRVCKNSEPKNPIFKLYCSSSGTTCGVTYLPLTTHHVGEL